MLNKMEIMDDSKQEDDNKLIAKFMGWYKCDCNHTADHYMYGKLHWQSVYVSDMDFHKNWKSLMPVLEKIQSLGSIDVVISIKGSVIISWDDSTAYYEQTKGKGRDSIETAHESAVTFIKWYNENNLLNIKI